jgi:hypothetical protein
MNAPQNHVTEDIEKLKEIPKWTRKYAQNRTLTILVLMVMFGLFGMFFAVLVGFPFALAVAGFRKGNMILGGVGIAVLVAVLVAYFKCLFILIRKYGGKNRGLIDRKIERWLYGKEGTVSMPGPKLMKENKWLEICISLAIFICFFGSWYLTMEGYIACKYLQPVSALYFVPSLVFQYFQRRRWLGPLLLISPILYTLHAVLIVAGVPIFFTGDLCILSICLPALGYSFLAYVLGHVYSRYALKKLKGLTHLEGEAANGD